MSRVSRACVAAVAWAAILLPISSAYGSKAGLESCIIGAAKHYRVHPDLIRAVLRQEGGRVGAESSNTNGTADIGPMQINSIHLKELAQYGINRELLRQDGCLNVYIGTWLLKREIAQAKDVWTGVGNYHSHTPFHNAKYQWLIWRRLQQLSASR